MTTRTLGQLVRERRLALGLSQIELARAAGCSPSRITALEGEALVQLPLPHHLRRIAATLRLDMRVLLEAAGYLDAPAPQQRTRESELRRFMEWHEARFGPDSMVPLLRCTVRHDDACAALRPGASPESCDCDPEMELPGGAV